MTEPSASAALALHSPGWWLLLALLVLLVIASLPVLFVYLLVRAVRRGTRPQETLTTLSLRPEADRLQHDRQDPFDGA